MNNSTGIYFVKKQNTQYQDITTMFDGVAVLKLEGLITQGKPINIYTEQWATEQEEDFCIPITENNETTVIRENTNIELTFVVKQKYATNNIDVLTTHNNFINYITNSDIWLKTKYYNMETHCVCLDEYKPTVVKLKRGNDKNFIMGTITLHQLNKPTTTT